MLIFSLFRLEQIETKLTRALEEQAAIVKPKKPLRQKENIPAMAESDLLQYIIRLLGMSRASIEQLNLSTVSSVKTPSSSIINISSNRKFSFSSMSTPVSSTSPMEQSQTIDGQKLQQLLQYIAENQKHIEPGEHEMGGNDIWKDILNKNGSNRKSTSKSENTKTGETVQNKTTMPASETTTTGNRIANTEELSKDDLILKYDELTANCTKRIINLDSMISKVREEKQKLLENTLSSAGSLITGQRENITEYLDYPQPQNAQNNVAEDATFPLSDSKSTTQAPSSDFSSTSGTVVDTSAPIENRSADLAATRGKTFGESKDSGVGNSRPVTSSDYRDSPDLKTQNKPGEHDKQNALALALRESKKDVPFEPLLKDIPKISYRIENEKGSEIDIISNRDKAQKPPPTALTR